MEIKKVALEWIEKNLNKGNWPEDDWISLTGDYDLNLYSEEDGSWGATIYPVVDGQTKVETWITVIQKP